MDTATDEKPVICPACGGANTLEAVFCANPDCHKALGEFSYVLEEIRAELRWHEVLADRVVEFIGKPLFLGTHIAWFTLWILINSGVLLMVHHFDQYPYSLLGIIISMEAIFITGFILISNNRQTLHATKRAELDYEVNVLTYRKIQQIESLLSQLSERLDKIEESDSLPPPKHL